MACATAGLVLGSVLGGPLAEYLVRRHRLRPATGPAATVNDDTDSAEDDAITTNSVLNTLFAILACLAGGNMLVRVVAGTGFILPTSSSACCSELRSATSPL